MHAQTLLELESQRNILTTNTMDNEVMLLSGCMTNPPFYAKEEEVYLIILIAIIINNK